MRPSRWSRLRQGAIDDAQDKLMTSDEYMSAVERGSTLYVAESGQRGLAMRIA